MKTMIIAAAVLAFTLLPVRGAGDDPAWVLLFNGRDLSGWQAKDGGKPGDGWVVEDGCLYRKDKAGDIVTGKNFEDFELEFEWKIAPGGNSGVKYRVQRGLGPEYQVLDDDGHKNGRDPFTSAASMYALVKPDAGKVLKPVGEFNTARIVARGNHLEHWLNGQKVLEIDVGSDTWDRQKQDSKFHNIRDYGVGPGRILLQDHGDAVWYRNLRIRELD